MKSRNLTRGRILFLSSIIVGLTFLTFNLIIGILAGAPISISKAIILYIAYIGVWLLASRKKVFRKVIGFILGIFAIFLIVSFQGGFGYAWRWSDLISAGVFSYVCFVFAISPDVDAYLKKRPNKEINSDLQ